MFSKILSYPYVCPFELSSAAKDAPEKPHLTTLGKNTAVEMLGMFRKPLHLRISGLESA